MWAKNKKIQKEQRSAFGCRRHCRVYVEVEILVEMVSFCLTGSSPHDAQPSHSSSSLSSWCDGDGGEVSGVSSLELGPNPHFSVLSNQRRISASNTDRSKLSKLSHGNISHLKLFWNFCEKKPWSFRASPLRPSKTENVPSASSFSAFRSAFEREKSSVKSVVNQWTKAGKEGRIWKKKGMIFRTTCQGRRMCTLKQSQLQLGQPSFGNEEDSRMRRRIKRRMRMTTPDPARLEPLRAKTPPKKDWFNHRSTPPKILWLNLRNQSFASSLQYVCKSRANSRWENPAFVKYAKFGIGCPKAASNAIGICPKKPPCTSAELDRHRCLADHKHLWSPRNSTSKVSRPSSVDSVGFKAEWLAMIFHLIFSPENLVV